MVVEPLDDPELDVVEPELEVVPELDVVVPELDVTPELLVAPELVDGGRPLEDPAPLDPV